MLWPARLVTGFRLVESCFSIHWFHWYYNNFGAHAIELDGCRMPHREVPMHHLVIVPHTHWDREWYRTHEEFRYRLVHLLDRLLDLLEGDPGFGHFTLDGQTIVLDDYLEVRPEERPRIERLVRAGRLSIGPWTVLPDEWLVSGEALVRNLRLGLQRAAEFGGGMRLGYVPDQFGHVGQLPQLFAGFGLEGAILWRGVGSDVDRTLFRWQAPDGTERLTVYLVHGYGNASHLPLEPEALAARLRAVVAAQKPHAAVPSLLLMNGSDHLEPQPGLQQALGQTRLQDATAEIGSLPGYFARARAESEGAELPRHRGELRSGLRSPLLEGCASARMPQKRADFLNDRLLVRYLEPLAAWLGELGGDPDPGMLERAWRMALENHPHDSICGCSIDAVHREMDVRFARVAQLSHTHLRHISAALAARVVLPAGPGAGLVVWNPNAAGPTLAEGEVELSIDDDAPGPLSLLGAGGARLPAHAEIVATGVELAHYELAGRVAAVLLRGFPEEFTGLRPCEVVVDRDGDRLSATLWLGEEPPQAFDFARERETLAARLEAEGDRQVLYRVRRRPRVKLGFVDTLPGWGLRSYRLGPAGADGPAAPGLVAEQREDGGAVIANEAWRIEVSPEGRVDWTHAPSACAVRDALRLVSEGDRGDEYTFDPVPGSAPVDRAEKVRVRLAPSSEASVAVAIELELRVPAGLAPDRTARSERHVPLSARIELRLWRGLDRVDLTADVDNTAEDHRLRLALAAPFAPRALEVESAFEVVERPLAPHPEAFGPNPAERPTGASPQRGFASLRGEQHRFTVANRGAAEVEAVATGEAATALAVTILRAVGWLSRGDLGMRPGHAGPALETPGAQVPGAHRVELALLIHRSDDPARGADAHRFVAPAWLFSGGGDSGELQDGSRLLELDAPGVRVSAIEPARSGGTWIRFYEAEGAPAQVRLRFFRGGSLLPVDLVGEPRPEPQLREDGEGGYVLGLAAHRISSLLRPAIS